MNQIQKILVPTDLSKTSQEAVNEAASLARWFKSEVVLLHAGSILHKEPSLRAIHLEQEALELKLQAQKLARSAQLMVSVEITKDRKPSEAILSFLSNNKIDLVVMGTHGRSGVGHLFLGSVAEAVVRGSPCPVVTVRRGKKRMEGEAPYGKILVGFDFSDHAAVAVRNAATLATSLGAAISVIHVYVPPIFPAPHNVLWQPVVKQLLGDVEKDAREALHELFGGFQDWDFCLENSGTSNPARQISRYARKEDVDLIVLGTHGLSGFDHLLLGSTSERVMRLAHCPVMTVKLSEQDSQG